MADAAMRLLKRNLLFRDLPEDLLGRIAGLARRRDFPQDVTVFSQGDTGDCLYGVVAGRVRIAAASSRGREVFLNIMEPGDTFGEIAVIDGLPRTAGAVTLDPATLVTIDRGDFLSVLEVEPVLAMHLLRLFCQRVRWTSELVEESTFLVGSARLAKRLLVLIAIHGRPVKAGMELAISQSELAQFLGISRQFVNQQLRSWRGMGWISLSRSRIVVTDAEALSQVAEGPAP